MATPEGRAKVRRFTLHQRLQHWFLVLTFTTLCLTGFPMKFADRAWAAWVIKALGGLTAVRNIHRFTGAALVIGFIYHAAYVFNYMRKSRKTTRQSWVKIFFNLPLCMNPRDLREMMALLAFLVGIRRTRPEGHRFTAEEKFEYFGVFWGTMLLGLTGFLMWFNGYVSRYLPGRVITASNLVHSFEAFLALLHVGILHVASVIFSPVVFPISPAMFTGDTPPGEMAESHSAMLADRDERDELPNAPVSVAEVRHV
jgi:formate dehydrogenase gamma subunit